MIQGDKTSNLDERLPLDLKRWISLLPLSEKRLFLSIMINFQHDDCSPSCTKYLHTFLALKEALISMSSTTNETPSNTLKFLTFWLAHELVLNKDMDELMTIFDDSSLLHLLFRCWYWSSQGEKELVNDYLGDMLALKEYLVREFSPVNVQFIIHMYEIIISTKFSLQEFDDVRRFINEERQFIDHALNNTEDAEIWSYWRWYPRIHELRLTVMTKGPTEAKKILQDWKKELSDLSFAMTSIHIFNTVGTIYMVANELKEAIFWFNKAITLGKRTGFVRSTIPAQSNLADIYFLLGQVKTAISMGKKALDGFQRLQTEFNVFLQLMSLITFHLANNDVTQATKYWKNALDVFQREPSLNIPMFKAFLYGRAIELGIDENQLPHGLVSDVMSMLNSEQLSALDPHGKIMFMECKVNLALKKGNLGTALEEIDEIINVCFEFDLITYAWQFTLRKLEILIPLAQFQHLQSKKLMLYRALSIFDDLHLYEDLQQRPLIKLRLLMARLALLRLINENDDIIARHQEELREFSNEIKQSATPEELASIHELDQHLSILLEQKDSMTTSLSSLEPETRQDITEYFLQKIAIDLLAELSRIPVAHSMEHHRPSIIAVLIQSLTGLSYFSLILDERINPDLLSGFIAALQTMSSSFTGEVGLLSAIKHEHFIIDFVPIVREGSFLTAFLDKEDPIVRHRLRLLANDLAGDSRLTSYLSADYVRYNDEMTKIIREKVEHYLGSFLETQNAPKMQENNNH